MITSVKVGAYDITVRWVSDLYTIGDKFGLFDNDKLEICICSTQNEQGKRDTMIHEISHAIWFVFDVGSGAKNKEEAETEEYIVRTTSTGWYGVIKDNPKLMRWLCEYKTTKTSSGKNKKTGCKKEKTDGRVSGC